LAFGMAVAIALADEEIHPNELSLLKILERAFELTDEEVNSIVRCIKSGRPLEDLFPNREEDRLVAYVEVMALAIAADGRVSRAEARALAEAVVKSPELKGLTLDRAQ